MTLATGAGSMPGEDLHENLKVVLGELADAPGLAFLPELPARGVTAGTVGRALATIGDLGVDLQPAGWRLTDASGVDHRRARSLLAQDLDALEEHTQGWSGPLKVQVAGPWTLAASVEKPRGDKVLSDHGARRDLAQALAEGVGAHVRDVRRRVPGVARLVVQVDEPALGSVRHGRVPTASGFGRHRSVDRPEISEALGWVLAAVTDAGGEPWVHSCAADTPLDLVRSAGARGLLVDVGVLEAAGHEVLATALEAGETVVLGLVPATDPGTAPSGGELVERVLRWLDMVGLDPEEVGPLLGVAGTCGHAGASPAWARRALAVAREAAASLP